MKKSITFYKKDELTKEMFDEILVIWQKSFNKVDTDIGLLDTTIVGIILDENKIVAITFLLVPDLKSLNSNIKEQGVTENDCYIYNFCVLESERKKGYGQDLLIKCHEYIKCLNKQNTLLFVEDGNIPAICLYNKYEYKVHRATPNGFIMKKIMD